MKPINKYEVYKELQDELSKRKKDHSRQVIRKEFQEIQTDPEAGCIYSTWKFEGSGDHLLKNCQELIHLIEPDFKKILINGTDINFSPSDLDYLIGQWFPLLYKAGVTHIAWVLDGLVITNFSTHPTSLQATDIKVDYFSTLDAAREWLNILGKP